jgi:Uma2 family endonuclease
MPIIRLKEDSLMSAQASSFRTFMTAEELFETPGTDYGYELVKGELIRMSPPGGIHGVLTAKLTKLLINYVDLHRLGLVCAGEPGFILFRNPDTVRAPDVAFISKDRIPPEGAPTGYWPFAPDLAVEVVSPGDRYEEIQEKIADYFHSGTRLVWIVEPKNRTVAVYNSLTEARILTESDALEGGNVIPGFSCLVAEIFE